MRCYFMRDGHIAAVEVLKSTADDDAAVKEARALFEARKSKFSAFEIWDRARFIYRHPASASESQPNSAPAAGKSQERP